MKYWHTELNVFQSDSNLQVPSDWDSIYPNDLDSGPNLLKRKLAQTCLTLKENLLTI